MSSADHMKQQMKRRPLFRRFIFLSPQITILSIVAGVLLVALIILGVIVVAQEHASATVLTINDTNRVFVQLQRETLRLLALVAQPDDAFQAQAVQLQHDLIESRIGVLNFPQTQASLPLTILQRAQQIQQRWQDIKPQIQAWKEEPTDATLRATVRSSLIDFEFVVNDTEVNYSRIKTQAVAEFARLNQQQLISFTVGGVILVMFLFIVAISIYRFNQQRQEVEAARKSRDEALAVSRLAQENARLKSEFLSTMSHELRTPMNAIEGFTSIMLNKMGGVEYNEKAHSYITRVSANSKRLLHLINDFLDLSRVEAGRLELANQPFSPEIVAERWRNEIGVLAEKKGLELEVRFDSTLPKTLYGDEEAISKIALNLLSNAIKFTEQGHVKLAMECVDGAWGITVEDTGIGIPPHAREFIFEEFRQVDQSSRRKYAGTGLGLAIVQKYARAMGGNVRVKSEVGKGSTFTVSLPLKTSA